MDSQATQQEVQRLVELLRSRAVEQCLEAAIELKTSGVRTRGVVRTRGAVMHSATQRMEGLDFAPALEALADAHWEVRREVSLAVGEWGDELSVEVLGHLACTDSEWRVRVAVAEALANIGGPQAVVVLKRMAQTDPHQEVRAKGVEGLGNLALATWPELADKPARDARGPVRTRGAIRVRGARPSKRVHPEAEAILDLLDQLRFYDQSSVVRDAADATLARLDE